MNRHTLDLGPLGRLVKQGLPDQDALAIGKAIASEMGRRIRSGGGGKTVDGQRIDPNSPGWAIKKRLSGRAQVDAPLVYTGRMTDPDAWETTWNGDAIVLTLRGEHRDKWDNIHEISDAKGRNWDQAWGIGSSEADIAMVYLDRAVKRMLKG